MTKISIKRPVTTMMILIVVILAGFLGYKLMPLAFMPTTDTAIAVVSTTYTGAGPEEMEKLITKPIEESVGVLAGIDTMSSTSAAGSSIITIQFVDGTDIDQAVIDLREKVDLVKQSLPTDADEPTISKVDTNTETLSVGVTSDILDVNSLYDMLDQNITEKFERIEGVSSVDIIGGEEDEVQITIDSRKLEGYGISVAQVRQALIAENQNIPSGTVSYGDTDLQLRAVGEFKSIDDIKNIPILTNNGNSIYISDIAQVKLSTKDKSTMSVIDGKEGILLSIAKASDANVVTVSDEVIKEINEIIKAYPELQIKLLTNTSEYIKTSVNNVLQTAYTSTIIAVIILLLFLGNFRTSLIIGVSIPTSILITFGLMYISGLTMNTISMGAIVIGIGMLVDSSVVVIENISKHFELGKTPKQAAYDGTREVGMAIFASTLTTVGCFLPLAFISGAIGQVLKTISLTICYSLSASLIIALTFVPMASSKLLRKGTDEDKRNTFSKIQEVWVKGINKLDTGYRALIEICLKNRIKTTAVIIGVFILSLTIVPGMGMELSPGSDQGTVKVTVEMPSGTKYVETEAMVLDVINKIGTIPEAENSYTQIGGSVLGQNSDPTIYFNLCDKQQRERTTDEIIDDIKGKISGIAGAKIKVEMGENANTMAGGNYDLNLNITGSDLDTLEQIVGELTDQFAEIPGAIEFETSQDEALPEGNIILNRSKAAKYGITTSDVASAVNMVTSGVVASQYNIDDTEVDIRIKYADEKTERINDLTNVMLTTNQGTKIPLSEVAEISTDKGASSITRRDQQRYITIYGKFDAAMDTGTIQSLVEEKLDGYQFPENYGYKFTGEMETMGDSLVEMILALIVAVVLVYAIMASQFESLVYPFIIMFTMPMAITGGILGLKITGNPISIIAFLGFIMLIGIVVNNAIVLIDYANQMREQHGVSANEAMLMAGPSRLRPILMTTLTSIFGLLPMAISTASGTETQKPIAITVMFGLTLSLFITLIYIPVLYSFVDQVLAKFKKSSQTESVEVF